MSAPVNQDIDVAENQVVYTRVFAAPRDLVFEAWTRPEHVRRWWGQRRFTVTVCEIDLRAGGAYRFVHRGPDGNDYPFKGVYREIVPPERLVYTQIFDVPGPSDHELLVTATFDERDGRTLLTGRLLFDSVEDRVAAMETGMAQGMAETLDRLEEHLAARKSG
jgi:uncharacterized protein YndB with AHSA1/START domain